MLTFKDIFGQEKAVEALQQAYLADRLPHGLIFAGPAGVGKGTTALALAALFLCENPKAAEPCGKCQSCTLMAAGNHPDYHLVYRQLVQLEDAEKAAQALSVDVVRDYLLKPAGQKSAMNQGKVFVVEEAETLNTAAQNSMLKTLEEPYGRTLIFLLTDQPESLLPTIRSRCRLVRFAPLSWERVVAELVKRGMKEAEAADAAEFSEGSLGLVLRWRNQGVLLAAKELHGVIARILSGQPSMDLAEWLKKASEDYSAIELKKGAGTKAQTTREGMALYLHLIAREFRVRLSQTEDAAELESLCRAIDAVAQAEEYLDANVTVALIFQQLAAKLEGLYPRAALTAI
jgi:DNA polymerase-3 subunit delta'